MSILLTQSVKGAGQGGTVSVTGTHVVQYQSQAAPVFQQAAAVPALSGATCPMPQARLALAAALAPAFFGVFTATSEASWKLEHPPAPAVVRALPAAQHAFYAAAPKPEQTLPSPWRKTEFPARVDRLPPAPQSWFTDTPRDTTVPLAARATFPDRLVLRPPIADYPAHALGVGLPNFPIPVLSWRGVFGDDALRVQPRLQWLFEPKPVVTPGAAPPAPDLSWQPQHPARLVNRQPTTQAWWTDPIRDVTLPSVARASFPDRLVLPRTFAPHHSHAYVTPLSQLPVPALSWSPFFPALQNRRRQIAWEGARGESWFAVFAPAIHHVAPVGRVVPVPKEDRKASVPAERRRVGVKGTD